MSEKTKLLSLSEKVNLPLFGDITHFILETAGINQKQISQLAQHCMLFDMEREPASVQAKYNFLYLGELLERYEERFGMPLPDLRAVALALGFTSSFLTKEMFVGSQKRDFVEKVKKQEAGDIYLTGALYLLGEDAAYREKSLLEWEFSATEELLFAMSLFSDFNVGFLHMKSQLVRLLGKERTIPVLGNMGLFGWLIKQISLVVKNVRTKDVELLRALCSLSKSFVKPGDKQYNTLLASAYTPLEIAYANTLAIRSQMSDGPISPRSIVAEKIAVELFRQSIPSEEPFSPEIYNQLTLLFCQFKEFQIKCYGVRKLMDALNNQVKIGNASTFAWLSALVGLPDPVFDCFDILDTKWDDLATLLGEKYNSLFRNSLHRDMTAEEIKKRIARYDNLTGTSYTGTCCEKAHTGSFRLLVEKEIIDLWELFCSILGENGQVIQTGTMECISGYLRNNFSVQTFRFYEKFFGKFGMEGIARFFQAYRDRIFANLVRQEYRCGKTYLTLALHREYFTDEEHRKVLGWLQEYYFMYDPGSYLAFVAMALRDSFAPSLLAKDEQRALFDLLIEWGELSVEERNALKQRYLSPEEIQAEKEEKDRKDQEQKKKWEAERLQRIRDDYKNHHGNFQEVCNFLSGYRYESRNRLTACKITARKMETLLQKNSLLGKEEIRCFLEVCGLLVAYETLNLADVQKYIQMIKEADVNGSADD